MLQPKGPFCRTNKFSDALAAAGNFNNHGLDTIKNADRNHDYSKDWKLTRV